MPYEIQIYDYRSDCWNGKFMSFSVNILKEVLLKKWRYGRIVDVYNGEIIYEER